MSEMDRNLCAKAVKSRGDGRRVTGIVTCIRHSDRFVADLRFEWRIESWQLSKWFEVIKWDRGSKSDGEE